HQVKEKQVPLAAMHQERDRPEVLLEETLEIVEDGGLVAAVVDGRRPGTIRSQRLLQLGEEPRIAAEVGRGGRAEESTQKETWEPPRRPWRVTHRHASSHRPLTMLCGDLPQQLRLDCPRRVDPSPQRVVPVLEELEDSMLSRVFAGHHRRPGHRTQWRK